MKSLKGMKLAALLGFVLAAATVPAIAAGDPPPATAAEVQASFDALEQSWTDLTTEIEASELGRNDAKAIAVAMSRAERRLEKARSRLERGDVRQAANDAEETAREIDSARKRLADAIAAGGER